jgi:amidase
LSELHYASLAEVCARIKSGALDSVTVTEHLLERIGALEPKLHSYVRVLGEDALADAARLDAAREAGAPLGALHGVPIALKDLLYTAGIPTASGTVVMRDFVPEEDATVVARLRAAGAVIIGKTQLTEGAFGVHHPELVAPVNPWNAERWTGVSSSGSGVAVAAGLAFAALGSDTGGSIRFPCASCGLVGVKPTYGRVSRFGAFPLAESLDHIGPMTRTVEDAARMLGVLAGADPKDPTTLDAPVPNYAGDLDGGVRGLRIGVDWAYVESGVEAAVVEGVREALHLLEDRGARIVEVTLPPSYERLVHDWGVTCGVECARAHQGIYPEQKARYGPVLSGLIELGRSVAQQDYDALEAVRRQFTGELDGLLQRVDLMISPCMPALAPTAQEMIDVASQDQSRADFLTFTAPTDYSGHPTITVPIGLAGGMPKTVQLVGARLAEALLLRAGRTLEEASAFAAHPLP